jgi:DNA-binding SARP family transcriptional activator
MDTTEDRASANLRTALWKLHSLRDRLVHGFGRYLEVAPDVSVDLKELVARARGLIAAADDDDEVDLAEVGELDADLLPHWDDDWVLFERERLRQLRVHAMEALCRRLSQAGRHGEAVDAGLSAVAAEPLRESGQRVLIEAHLEEGNLYEARRQFEIYRSLLWEQLRVFPSVSLCSLVGVMSPGSNG